MEALAAVGEEPAVDDEEAAPAVAPAEAAESPSGGVAKKAKTADEVWTQAVKGSVLLKKLSSSELKYVKTAAKAVKYVAGAIVYTEEATPDNYYVVQSGRYHADRETAAGTRLLREYSAGDSFGSHELLFSTPRAAKITCMVGGSLWVISKRVFDSKLRIPPAIKPATLELIKTLPLFEGLGAEQLAALARAAVEVSVEGGQTVCAEGDAVRAHVEALCRPLAPRRLAALRIPHPLLTLSGPAGVLAGTGGLCDSLRQLCHVQGRHGPRLHDDCQQLCASLPRLSAVLAILCVCILRCAVLAVARQASVSRRCSAPAPSTARTCAAAKPR